MDTINDLIHRSLWEDYDDVSEFPSKTPLLAHYTSIQNFDYIVEGEEIWFSNPLNMNDLDELVFGMNQGAAEFRGNEALIEACGSEKVFGQLLHYFDHYFNQFDENHVLDTYISCFSLHDKDDFDGVLSMWRGYGANGDGVAFVIDTKQIEPNEKSPLILSSVKYVTKESRLEWIKHKIHSLAELLKEQEKSDEVLNAIAWYWIERLKVFSLFTKHIGFKEEKEWRFVYLNDKDPEGHFASMFGYNITEKGVEPKLKLKLSQIPGMNAPLTVDGLIDRIILGPTVSSELSMRSVRRMLQIKGKLELSNKVFASTIPYRP
ncbi:DUF2971 domain-containing protein [Sedimenticola selenatireducens]|uniref:DUF2971 domain-containing protein n=1 Tax=Sedimenticola selenatireducens TaxID=191960 RepID=A0A558DT70_9GAMM|nr:DUF2971 domain-containing protein [Sedimenticola selenatireducens]TVO76799.1 DUF2971 domain-containing protein [Sedimenticola selenatireducens]TVT64242.1 MAG: DUF2971 domain-containing protein [Sedimenticola selenatireducens]